MRLSSKFLDRFPTIQEKTFATIWMFNKSNTVAREIASDEKDRSFISECFFQIIVCRINDMKKLSEKAKDINLEQVVKLTVDSELQKIAGGTPKPHIHWAPTQSGKSAFKAVKILVYLTMNVPVVVITKGKSESIELESKISNYLEDSRFAFENRVFSVYEEDIEISFLQNEKACCTIIPDSYQKIELAHYLLSESVQSARGCAVILDEVDAIIHRSEEQEQKNEKALISLQEELKPSMVMVTATPIPLFMYLKERLSFTTSNKIIEDYIGVKDMIHTHIDPDSLKQRVPIDGVVEISPKHIHENVCKSETSMRLYVSEHALFETDILQLAKKFPNVCRTGNIPRINSECFGFLKEDVTKAGAVGMLALVDTCPWVASAKGTVFEQASGVQDYFAVLGHKFVAVVVHAEKIFYRLPGHRNGLRCYNTIGELLDKIDKKLGLQMPVIVFGYHAMKRSRSYRSSNRVPSSMIMCLGKGHSTENCRQAAGRATTKGRKQLLRNRKTDKVSILCPQEDFNIIQKYDPLTLEIVKLYTEKGLSWEDLKRLLSPENNFLDDCHRRFGNFTPGEKKRRRRRTSSQPANRLFGSEEEATLARPLVCYTSARASSPAPSSEDVLMTTAARMIETIVIDDKEDTIVIDDEDSNRQEFSLSGSSDGYSEEQLDATSTATRNNLHTSEISVSEQDGKTKSHPCEDLADSKREPYEPKHERSRKRFEVDSKNVEIKIENYKNKRQRSGSTIFKNEKMFDLTYGDQHCTIDLTEDEDYAIDLTENDSKENEISYSTVNFDETMIDNADSSDKPVINLADGDDKYCAIDLVEGEDWEMV